jgi:serine/threonine protein phosphatase PrpC
MHYTFFAQTDPGRSRSNNEDAVVFDEGTHLGVLADGMGGYNAGEVASGMATEFIRAELSAWLTEAGAQADKLQMRQAIEMCVDNANAAILEAANTNAHYSGMGTTLVVGVFHGDRLLLGHVGDSRCYRLRGDTLTQITRDHSLLQEQLDAGLLTAEEAALSPYKNLVTRALGVEAGVMLELNEHLLEPGDIYLMCSDGLSDMMNDAQIAGTLRQRAALSVMANHLVAQANDNGGRDNIAVLLTRVASNSEKRGLISRWLGK